MTQPQKLHRVFAFLASGNNTYPIYRLISQAHDGWNRALAIHLQKESITFKDNWGPPLGLQQAIDLVLGPAFQPAGEPVTIQCIDDEGTFDFKPDHSSDLFLMPKPELHLIDMILAYALQY